MFLFFFFRKIALQVQMVKRGTVQASTFNKCVPMVVSQLPGCSSVLGDPHTFRRSCCPEGIYRTTYRDDSEKGRTLCRIRVRKL